MAHLVLAMSRYGAVAGTLLSATVPFALFVWMLSIVAAELDSILMALVVTAIVLLPLASPLASVGRPPRR